MMGFPGGNVPDLSEAEVVDFTIESGETRVRLKLKDGSVLEVRMEITNILRVGNDPATGLPSYLIQSANILRLVSCPKELRKKPLRAGNKENSKPIAGFG